MSYSDIRRENAKALLSAEAKAARERIEHCRRRSAVEGPKEWAWLLRERELAGEKLSLASAAAWRHALANELEEGELR